jgi:phosphate uptake regulator
MLKQILTAIRTYGVMTAAEQNIREMFRVSREIYNASSMALLEQKDVEFDLYARDREINMLVVDTRKKIVEHLSISKSHHVGGELVYLKVINDIERVGDYSKNLLDLANLMPEPLTEGCYYDRLKDLFPKVDASFDKAERALFDGVEEDANAVIQNHLQITRSCKDILASLIQDPKLYSHEAIAIALTARYFKRVSSHLKNVASTAVNPFSHIGYMGTPKVEDPGENNPVCE